MWINVLHFTAILSSIFSSAGAGESSNNVQHHHTSLIRVWTWRRVTQTFWMGSAGVRNFKTLIQPQDVTEWLIFSTQHLWSRLPSGAPVNMIIPDFTVQPEDIYILLLTWFCSWFISWYFWCGFEGFLRFYVIVCNFVCCLSRSGPP